jgi:hypothetical protein
MCAADWPLILEYFKVLLSWPVAAVILTLYLAPKFREPVHDLIKRVTKASLPGVELEVSAAQTTFLPAELKPPEAARSRDAELPPALRDDPGIRSALEFIKEFPTQALIFHRQTLFWLNFERVFIRAYGTQIAALVELESATAPLPLATLEKHHAEHLRLAKKTDYPSEAYFGFLETYSLIQRVDASGNRAYVLTQTGRDFLEYIRTNYPIDWNSRAL